LLSHVRLESLTYAVKGEFMRIFLTGGTGLVGSRLIDRLTERGDQIILLTRRPEAAKQGVCAKCTVVEGDPTVQGGWMDAIANCDAVVHLAGEGIFGRRWTAEFKELLRTSRVQGTGNVAEAVRRAPPLGDGRPRVLVSASAIGYYGPRGDEPLDESAPPGDDFLARVCVEWEAAARPAREAGARVVWLRIGIVLDPKGGALKKMKPPFMMFVGGPIGSGKQFMSWIHHEDLTGLILLALDNPQAEGPLNATAPNPVTNKQFSRALGGVLGRPSFLPAPAFALKVLLGESADM
jgi:uncharacterized protein (TIGR01777 family)